MESLEFSTHIMLSSDGEIYVLLTVAGGVAASLIAHATRRRRFLQEIGLSCGTNCRRYSSSIESLYMYHTAETISSVILKLMSHLHIQC